MEKYYDLLTSIVQSLLFVYIISYCLDIDKKKNIIKLVSCLILFSINAVVLPQIFNSILLSLFATHICGLIIIYLFFKQSFISVVVSYSLIYLILAIWIFIFGNLFYGIWQKIASVQYEEIISNILLYDSQIILFILCYVLRYKIKQIYKLVSSMNISIIFIAILSFIPDFLLSTYFISYYIDESMLKNVVLIALVMFLCLSICLFFRIKGRAAEINNLNEILASKNDELKSIKNNYGLQINCLYELCSMEKYYDAISTLKIIINNSNNEGKTGASEKDISLLALATKHAPSENVNVIVEDKADFKQTTIPEIELYRIIINIVNNAIRAIKNKGTLIAKSSQDLKNIIITIENDGEKIPEEIIDKIFDSGFTTKNNIDESHGYGLSIAKELIGKHGGDISVESDNERTIFTIILPRKYN